MNKLFFLGGLIFLNVSCDPGTQYVNSVVNKSKYEVRLIGNPVAMFDTINVKTNNTYEIINRVQLGTLEQNQSRYQDCKDGAEYIKQIEFLIEDSIVGRYQPIPSDWKFKIMDNPKSNYGCECEWILNDDFIQIK